MFIKLILNLKKIKIECVLKLQIKNWVNMSKCMALLIIIVSPGYWGDFKTRQNLTRDMTKPTKWQCAQRRLRSAWASAKSDQSLRCPHEESLGAQLPTERTAKTLIRLGGILGWSESSLDPQSLCWFWHVVTHLICELSRELLQNDKLKMHLSMDLLNSP